MIFSIAIALSAYFLVIHFVVDPRLSQTDRQGALLDFYGQPHDGDIFVLGSSMVREGVDSFIVEDSLRREGLNRSVYNLGYDGDTPLSRIPELASLVSSAPDLIVIGISYRDLSKQETIDTERLAALSQERICNEDCLLLFSNSQRKLLTLSSNEYFLYKRKFIISSITSLIQGILSRGKTNRGTIDLAREIMYIPNFKDPWIHSLNKTEAEKLEIWKNAENITPISDQDSPQKNAILQIIERCQASGIDVVVLNMPINPLMSQAVNESTRRNFGNFLNSTGVEWHDYEREYPSELFTDTTHLNIAGRIDFSQKVAAIIVNHKKRVPE